MAELAKAKEDIHAMENERDSLKDNLKKENEKVKNLTMETKDLKPDNDNLVKQIEEMNAKLNETLNECGKLKEKPNELMTTYEPKLNELQALSNDLKDKNDKLAKENDILKKHLDDILDERKKRNSDRRKRKEEQMKKVVAQANKKLEEDKKKLDEKKNMIEATECVKNARVAQEDLKNCPEPKSKTTETPQYFFEDDIPNYAVGEIPVDIHALDQPVSSYDRKATKKDPSDTRPPPRLGSKQGFQVKEPSFEQRAPYQRIAEEPIVNECSGKPGSNKGNEPGAGYKSSKKSTQYEQQIERRKVVKTMTYDIERRVSSKPGAYDPEGRRGGKPGEYEAEGRRGGNVGSSEQDRRRSVKVEGNEAEVRRGGIAAAYEQVERRGGKIVEHETEGRPEYEGEGNAGNEYEKGRINEENEIVNECKGKVVKKPNEFDAEGRQKQGNEPEPENREYDQERREQNANEYGGENIQAQKEFDPEANKPAPYSQSIYDFKGYPTPEEEFRGRSSYQSHTHTHEEHEMIQAWDNDPHCPYSHTREIYPGYAEFASLPNEEVWTAVNVNKRDRQKVMQNAREFLEKAKNNPRFKDIFQKQFPGLDVTKLPEDQFYEFAVKLLDLMKKFNDKNYQEVPPPPKEEEKKKPELSEEELKDLASKALKAKFNIVPGPKGTLKAMLDEDEEEDCLIPEDKFAEIIGLSVLSAARHGPGHRW